MAVQDEGMDLTIGLKVDVAAFRKEWAANYKKQIQDIVSATPVSLRVDVKSISSDIQRINAEVKKVTSVSGDALVAPEALERLNAVAERWQKTQEVAAARRKATEQENQRIMTSQVNTIEDMRRKIKLLTAERNKLPVGSKAFMDAQKQIDALSASVRQYNQSTRMASTYTRNLNEALRTQKGILNGMPQFLNAYVSVLGAYRLVDNIRRVTAEFDLQRTALQAIIQDKVFADQLFEKTVSLAVQSPFTAKELVTYTKQLAAYRIEQEDLYDTTKMLADVSAGLGVSVERLILAYGQVKAASVLRGTEVRQFTEAGIPLIEELADKYTELEGRVVSTAEVFDRISRRKVPFADVADIFQQMTSRGGIFYDMQRKQAETLYGLYQKIADQFQLTMAQVGESNMSAFRAGGEAALFVAKNLQSIVNGLLAAGAAWGAYNVAQKAYVLYLGQANAEILKSIQAQKAHEASMLRQKAALTQLTAAEQLRLVNTRALTAADVTAITKSEGYNAALGARLVATKKINTALAMQMSTELGLTKAQIEQLSNMGRFRAAANLLGASISRVTASIKAMTAAMLSNPLTWLAAIVSGIMYFVNRSKEAEAAIKKVREAMLDQAESMDAAYKRVSTTLNSEKSTVEQQITAYESILKKNSDIYPLVKKRLETVTTEAEKLTILKDTYEDIKTMLDDAGFAQGFMNAVRDAERFFRSFEKDIDDIPNSVEKVSTAISKAMRKVGVDSKPYRELSADVNELWNSFAKGEISINDFYLKLQLLETRFYDLDLSKPFRTLTQDVGDAMEVLTIMRNNISLELSKMFPDFDFANLTKEQTQQVENAVVTMVTNGIKGMEKLSATGKQIVQDYIYNAYNIATAGKDALSTVIETDLPQGGPTPSQILKGEVDIMKKAFDQYKKLASVLGRGAAFDKVNAAFRELMQNFKYLPKDMDIPTSVSDYIDVLRKALESEAADADMRLSLKTEISSEEVSDIVENMKRALSDAKEQIERSKVANTFYESLLASGFGEPVAWQMTMDLYGANPMDIRAQMEKNLQEAFKEKLQIDMPLSLADAEATVKQNADKIGSETASMLLGLISDLRNYDAETIKSLQDNLSKTSEIEAKRIKIYRDSAAQIAKLRTTAIPAEQKRLIEENIKQSQSERLASLGWEEFKAGDLYTSLFSDLDKVSTAALRRLRDRLEELKGQLSDLPADQLKEIMSAMTKLDKELVERDPFSAVVDNIGALFGGYKRLRQAEEEYIVAQNIADGYQRKYNDLLGERLNLESQIQALRRSGGDTSALEQELAEKEKEIERLKIQLDSAKATAKGKKTIADEEQRSIDDMQSGLSEVDKSLSEIRNGFSNIRDLIETIGVDLEGTSIGAMFDGIDAGIKAMQSIVSIMQSIIALKQILNTSNPWGWIALGVSAIAGTLTAIFNAKTNRLQKTIEDQENAVHNLQRAYERLEDAAEKALGSDLVRVTREQEANLKAQAEAYRKMYEAESQKGKKRDTEKMQEYWEAYEDALRDAQQVHEELVNSLLGSDIVSAARDIASAWLDTRISMGDAMEGITEDFNEMVQNMIVESLMARVVQQRLQSLYDAVDKAISEESQGGEEVTPQEIADLAALAQAIAASTGQELESIFQSLQQAGFDLQHGESNLTGISAAAANITEDTALTLGAIGNNLVYYVVGIHDLLAARFSMEGVNADTATPTLLSVQQAALTQLQAIQNNTARSALAAEQLASALSSVISPVGVKSGAKAINVNL